MRSTLRLALAAVLAGALSPGLAAMQAPVPTPPATPVVQQLQITILSTMLADEGFGEWGFAALVEVDGRRILFDTGAHEDTVARNANALKLDLSDVEAVVLSHNHADHTTGLLPLRQQLAARRATALATVYGGRGIFWPRVAGANVTNRMAQVRTAFEATGGRIVEVSAPLQLQPGVWLTGPVPRVHPERNWSGTGRVRSDAGEVEDTVPEDMTLVIQTRDGLVLLFGCGHAGVINTLDHTRAAIAPGPVKAIIGGLHLFDANEAHLKWTAGELRRFGVQQIVGAHCTGVEAVYRLRALAGLTRETCMVGAVGASYSLDRGINPLRVAK